MRDADGASGTHPLGEREIVGRLLPPDFARRLAVDTGGGRFHVEWDEDAPVTPLGQLVFFMQFLAAGGLFAGWMRECPLRYASAHAPEVLDVLGTMVLGVLSGQRRYAHLNALRADSVNPRGLGMKTVCSEDSVRRAFLGVDENEYPQISGENSNSESELMSFGATSTVARNLTRRGGGSRKLRFQTRHHVFDQRLPLFLQLFVKLLLNLAALLAIPFGKECPAFAVEGQARFIDRAVDFFGDLSPPHSLAIREHLFFLWW